MHGQQNIKIILLCCGLLMVHVLL